ncbi:unnamed protein product [Vicia faba]|uniref:Uncharacterized protein n=1 Tax=Vicia faba TaxID=3906 RepID=A0AAV0YF33_VICFA|nr:unnamed protein product [Vicia faba]
MAFLQDQFQRHYQTQPQPQPQTNSFRNLRTMDGQMSQQMAFYNPTDLQDQSQHPPYIPPFHVVGFAPGPVLPADGSDGGVDFALEFWFGTGEEETKRTGFFGEQFSDIFCGFPTTSICVHGIGIVA